MTDKPLSIEDVAELAGHHSPDFAYKKYVHADARVLDRTREATAD